MIPESEDILEAVRKAVKQVGKEAATQRLTLGEKQASADIEYSYKRQGMKTNGVCETRFTQVDNIENLREVRRHPLAIRYTLLAAFCWQRGQEITDTLIRGISLQYQG